MTHSGVAHGDAEDSGVFAAQYVRMSTDHQRYSIDNQAAEIAKYAAAHGIRVVRSYEDWGRSGLTLKGREGLRRLINDVLSGEPGFQVLIVYDVSRWGRFQDADESAHYEYLCKRSGVQVTYCAEPFENDGSPMATVFKSLKRAMAGEFSRELSNKVHLGALKNAGRGLRQGGPAGFGLRRQMIDQEGNPVAVLECGQHKYLISHHIVLVPGPRAEVKVVRWIFDRFVNKNDTRAGIARRLNSRGLRNYTGSEWKLSTVGEILTNEKYIGNNVWNRTGHRLKTPVKANPEAEWVRVDGAFEPIVSPEIFWRAQAIIRSQARNLSDEELLAKLRGLYEREGVVTAEMINADPDLPSASGYRSRFGTLIRAYELIGFRTTRDNSYIEVNRMLAACRPAVVAEIAAGLRAKGAHVNCGQQGLMTINRTSTLRVSIARYCARVLPTRKHWRLFFNRRVRSDRTLYVRMDETDVSRLDQYLFPRNDRFFGPLWIARDNEPDLDQYRLQSLDQLYSMYAPAATGRIMERYPGI